MPGRGGPVSAGTGLSDAHLSLSETATRPKILVYGPFQPSEVACGISAAVRTFAGSRVRNYYDIELFSTFRTNRKRSLFERITFGVWLCAKTVLQMRRSGAVLADIHAVSDRSLLSHAAVMFGARLAGCPALLRIHGGDFHLIFERASGLQRLLTRFILRAATRVVVLSEIWRSRIKMIEPCTAVEVIPNSVDCLSFGQLSIRPPRKCRRILFLANFCERKGHFDAIEAIGKLVSEYPDLVLALGGENRDPGTMERIEREADRLGVRGRIEFLGTVSGDAKDQALRDADILILPSHTENMPVSVIEGMAAALPVIATRVGAVSEMIKDGETGLLLEARDPEALAQRLAQLLSDADLGRRLGRQAQRHAYATWDADLVAERTIELYARLIAGKISRVS